MTKEEIYNKWKELVSESSKSMAYLHPGSRHSLEDWHKVYDNAAFLLSEEYAQQLAPLSDAVEFVRWKDRRYNKERKGYVLRKVYANNPSLANVKYWSVEELYEQFKSEQPAQIATDDDRRFTLKEMLEYGKAAFQFTDSGNKYGSGFANQKRYFKEKFNIDL